MILERYPTPTALVGGVLLGLSFPPRGWWYLAAVGTALAIVAWSGAGWRRRLWLGFVTGAGMFGTGLVLVAIGGFPALVLVAETVAALVLAGMVAAIAVATPRGPAALVGAPAAFVLVAAVKARWPFGGLPGIGLSFGQIDGPISTLARLGGGFLVVGGVALLGAVLAAPLVARRVVVTPLALAAVLAALLSGASLAPTGHDTGSIRVAAVQAGGERGVDAMSFEEVTEAHVDLAERLEGPLDLVVFPEGTVHGDEPVGSAAAVREVADLADRLDSTVVLGVVGDTDHRTFRNSALVLGPDGGLLARYDKVHGVPFAEYVPGRSVLERVVDLSLVPTDIEVGHEPGVVATPAGRLGILVSFEVFFPRLARAVVSQGADIIVVPTNAGSFRGDQVPTYELAASRLRALETGRAVVQVSPTGYTAFIGPDGTVLALTGLGRVAATPQRELPLRAGATPFGAVGPWPTALAALIALVASWAWAGRLVAGAEPDQPQRDGREHESGGVTHDVERGTAAP